MPVCLLFAMNTAKRFRAIQKRQGEKGQADIILKNLSFFSHIFSRHNTNFPLLSPEKGLRFV